MNISTIDAQQLVRRFRNLRNALLRAGRTLEVKQRQAIGKVAAQLDQLALDVKSGKRSRTVIDTEFSRILLRMGGMNLPPEVFED